MTGSTYTNISTISQVVSNLQGSYETVNPGGTIDTFDSPMMGYLVTEKRFSKGGSVTVPFDPETAPGDFEVTGALKVDGSLGLFGHAPASKPSAYTQTYSTSVKTLGAYTPDTESGAYTAQTTESIAKLDDLNALRVAYENLRAFVENIAKVENAVIDDMQSIGMF